MILGLAIISHTPIHVSARNGCFRHSQRMPSHLTCNTREFCHPGLTRMRGHSRRWMCLPCSWQRRPCCTACSRFWGYPPCFPRLRCSFRDVCMRTFTHARLKARACSRRCMTSCQSMKWVCSGACAFPILFLHLLLLLRHACEYHVCVCVCIFRRALGFGYGRRHINKAAIS